jgi:hypothetical protein
LLLLLLRLRRLWKTERGETFDDSLDRGAPPMMLFSRRAVSAAMGLPLTVCVRLRLASSNS